MNWTILNSIDLAKIFPNSSTRIIMSSRFTKKAELLKFFDSYKIPYELSLKSHQPEDAIFFGRDCDFKVLYIIAGIVKSYGFKILYYHSSLTDIVTLGAIKRKKIKSNLYPIEIDEILKISFDIEMSSFFKLFDINDRKKIDINAYCIENDLIIPDHTENEDTNDWLKAIRDIDPYENFHWGGLSGEEAYDGYWNHE